MPKRVKPHSQKVENAYLQMTELLVKRCGFNLSFLVSAHAPKQQSQNFQPTDLLDSTQSAAFLGLSSKTLANWRVSGHHELPYRQIGSAIRYQYSDLQTFANNSKRLNTSQTRRGVK